jgi:hypothetical protein
MGVRSMFYDFKAEVIVIYNRPQLKIKTLPN